MTFRELIQGVQEYAGECALDCNITVYKSEWKVPVLIESFYIDGHDLVLDLDE